MAGVLERAAGLAEETGLAGDEDGSEKEEGEVVIPDNKCDVCEQPVKGGEYAVLAGPGPISCCYCRRCAEAGVYPTWAIVAYTYTLDFDDISPEFMKVVVRSYEHVGKTLDDFRAEHAEAVKDMYRYFDEQREAGNEDTV